MIVTVSLSPGERMSLSLEATAAQISFETRLESREGASRPRPTDQGVCIFRLAGDPPLDADYNLSSHKHLPTIRARDHIGIPHGNVDFGSPGHEPHMTCSARQAFWFPVNAQTLFVMN